MLARDDAVRGGAVGASRETASACTSTCSRACRRCARTGGGLSTRAEPLSGLTDMPVRAGTVALVCAVIGTTTFDGLTNGGAVAHERAEPAEPASRISASIRRPRWSSPTRWGSCCAWRSWRGSSALASWGCAASASRYGSVELSHAFVHTLVPIGFAYVLAHYFSLLIWQGQAIGYLASDPLGNGANIFGTSSYQIDYAIISYAAIWYVQVAALVAGHVGGLDARARSGAQHLHATRRRRSARSTGCSR